MDHSLSCNVGKDKGLTGDIPCHKWNDVIDMINQAFIDGHVEKKDGKKLKIRYGYGTSPTGAWIWR